MRCTYEQRFDRKKGLRIRCSELDVMVQIYLACSARQQSPTEGQTRSSVIQLARGPAHWSLSPKLLSESHGFLLNRTNFSRPPRCLHSPGLTASLRSALRRRVSGSFMKSQQLRAGGSSLEPMCPTFCPISGRWLLLEHLQRQLSHPPPQGTAFKGPVVTNTPDVSQSQASSPGISPDFQPHFSLLLEISSEDLRASQN